MVVKYCGNCFGRPYTSDFTLCNCPKCGGVLSMESVGEAELAGRPQLITRQSGSQNISFEPSDRNTHQTGKTKQGSCFHPVNNMNTATDIKTGIPNIYEPNGGNNNLPDTPRRGKNGSETTEITPNQYFEQSRTIHGKVSQYSSTGKEDGNYRRLFPVKLFQAIVYRQRLEDVLHRFTVRVEQSGDAMGYQQYTDIPVNVHGTISGGMQIFDSAEVDVHGKYRNGVLMADRVEIINNGYRSKVGFQRSIKAIIAGIVSALVLITLIAVSVASKADFFEAVALLGTVWLGLTVLFSVLSIVLSFSKFGIMRRMFSKKQHSFPIVGILVISFILAVLFVVYAAPGLGLL